MAAAPMTENQAQSPLLERILDIARWAPSGDNSQPWRFTILNEHTVRITLQRELTNVYEYKDGEPVLLSAGALLENIRLAASAEKMAMHWTYDGYEAPNFTVTVTLQPDPSVQPDPLLAVVTTRSVQRKPMHKTPLSAEQKTLLAQSLGKELRLHWFEDSAEIVGLSRLNALAADVRLRIPEAYAVHARMLEWNQLQSDHKVPIRTLPLTPLTRVIMHWALGSWARVRFLNRYFMGTLMPQLELELIPGLASAAHFSISLATPSNDPAQALRNGQAIQRFWLTATALGLGMQPSFAALIFAHYGRHHIDFTRLPGVGPRAEKLAARAAQLYQKTGVSMDALVFAGRIGQPKVTQLQSRSTRLPLAQLITP